MPSHHDFFITVSVRRRRVRLHIGGSDEAAGATPVARVSMASIAAAGAAAAAIGVWYSQRRAPQLSEFTEPPKTWGDAVLRLHEVVRVSWKEALSKLGIWRLDHLLAIRHLSSRDLSVEIAEEIKTHGVLVEVRATRAPSPPPARASLGRIRGRHGTLRALTTRVRFPRPL